MTRSCFLPAAVLPVVLLAASVGSTSGAAIEPLSAKTLQPWVEKQVAAGKTAVVRWSEVDTASKYPENKAIVKNQSEAWKEAAKTWEKFHSKPHEVVMFGEVLFGDSPPAVPPSSFDKEFGEDMLNSLREDSGCTFRHYNKYALFGDHGNEYLSPPTDMAPMCQDLLTVKEMFTYFENSIALLVEDEKEATREFVNKLKGEV